MESSLRSPRVTRELLCLELGRLATARRGGCVTEPAPPPQGGRTASKPRSCKQGSVIPGRTTLFSSRLVGDLIGCGAGGGRGGVVSLETSRVALGGVFESEIGARCASVILECCLLGARGRAKPRWLETKVQARVSLRTSASRDARARRGVPPSNWLVLARPRAPARWSARCVAFFVAD